jgi:hypothetical protein
MARETHLVSTGYIACWVQNMARLAPCLVLESGYMNTRMPKWLITPQLLRVQSDHEKLIRFRRRHQWQNLLRGQKYC